MRGPQRQCKPSVTQMLRLLLAFVFLVLPWYGGPAETSSSGRGAVRCATTEALRDAFALGCPTLMGDSAAVDTAEADAASDPVVGEEQSWALLAPAGSITVRPDLFTTEDRASAAWEPAGQRTWSKRARAPPGG